MSAPSLPVDARSTPGTIWELALRVGEGFAIAGDHDPVPKADVIEQARDLAQVLQEGGTADGRALVAVATAGPVATTVAVLALSSIGRPAAIVGALSTQWNLDALRSLSTSVVIRDTGNVQLQGVTSAEVRLARRTGHVIGHRSGLDGPLPRRLPVDDGPVALRPFLAFRTSGTSGHPRWVVHSEASLWASLDSKVRGIARLERGEGLSDDARSVVHAVVGAPRAVFIPLTTISGYTQLVHALALDVPFISTTQALHRRALRLVSSSGAGTMVVTPSILRLMLTLPEAQSLQWDRLGIVGLGGGRLRPDLFVAAEETFGAKVIQGYGSTEFGGAVTNVRIYDGEQVRRDTVGRPLGGVEIQIRRPDGSEAEPSEAGEIVVRAPERLALGELASGSQGGIKSLGTDDGWYRTGDNGAVRPDGNLVVLGNADGKICRGDEAFFPQEVEEVLEMHPAVLRALVITEERTTAVVVRAVCEVTAGAHVSAAEIRSWCAGRLSRPRCPDVIAFDAVPCTSTGKTVRKVDW